MLLSVLATVLACSKENLSAGGAETDEEIPEEPQEEWVDATLGSLLVSDDPSASPAAASKSGLVRFVFEEDASSLTKTSLGGSTGKTVLWSEGDELNIFDTRYKGAGSCFAGTHEGAVKSCKFAGRIREFTSSFFSVYPYQKDAYFDGSKTLTMTIPTSQDAVNGSFASGAALAFARGAFNAERSTDDDVVFTPLCSVLSFTMPDYVDGARSVVVRANSGVPVAGTVSVDCEDAQLTSGGDATAVTLSGDAMAASGVYYAVVAPGTYEGGFNFTVTTAAGSTYTARSSKTVEAQPGVIYKIGTVNLALDVAPTVTISHTTNAAGELSGSIASLDIPQVQKDLEDMVKAWSATLKKDGVVVRTLSKSAGTMTVANGWTYLPKGSYDIEVRYTLVNGKTKTLAGTATSPAPNFTVTVDGYTSYNYGVGADGYEKNLSTANDLDNSTIYGISSKIGITSEVLAQMNYTALTCSLDGTQVSSSSSGQSTAIVSKGSQSWNSHTITGSATFDGVKKDASSRMVYVTGLPWGHSGNTSYNLGSWSYSSTKSTMSHGQENSYYYFKHSLGATSSLSKSFYIPTGSVNINASYKIEIIRKAATGPVMSYVDVGGNRISDMTSSYKLFSGETLKDETVKQTTLSSSNASASASMKTNASTVGSEVRIYYINLLYR